ncbi:uncharacterized protein LOC110980520 [Acanthaster planci]|uniref:Uncharacterized protein LOC110980520 n=1 Tax=Acanthaster planci TaxID=133434 RepID=A0A8B7YIC1_ACAPL|nr:uncharacterized protein LOC110980520 [Acanthaster planci]
MASDDSQSIYRKVDTILKNQKVQLSLLRTLNSKASGPDEEDVDDLLPRLMDLVEEIDSLSQELDNSEDPNFRRKLIHHLNTLGGFDLGETAGACQKSHPAAKRIKIEETLTNVLKYCPHEKKGGGTNTRNLQ